MSFCKKSHENSLLYGWAGLHALKAIAHIYNWVDKTKVLVTDEIMTCCIGCNVWANVDAQIRSDVHIGYQTKMIIVVIAYQTKVIAKEMVL
jgi:hypothetical protein